MKKIVVSGYFDPLHIGHVRMFEDAAKHGDLTVIVNNRAQTLNKKGFEFMPVAERVEVIRALGCVADVVEAIDEDRSVCATLRQIKPDIFANGGDRFEDNIPEKILCDELGIEMMFNVGGGKDQSSSTLNNQRQWGRYEIMQIGDGYKVKRLLVNPRSSLSYQRHFKRSEHWVVIAGQALVRPGNGPIRVLDKGQHYFVPVQDWHQLINQNDHPLEVIEVAIGDYIEEDDIERKEVK